MSSAVYEQWYNCDLFAFTVTLTVKLGVTAAAARVVAKVQTRK